MNRRIEIKLTTWQRQRLKQVRDNPPTPRIGKRAVCLLLSADGACNKLISDVTGLTTDSVTHIRRRWQQRKTGSLRELPRPGRPPKITDQYRRQLRQALKAGPLSYGFLFATWSIARLNTYLESVTDIKVCNDWPRQLVLAEGYVYRRPEYTLKGKRDERAFRKVQKALNRLKKGH